MAAGLPPLERPVIQIHMPVPSKGLDAVRFALARMRLWRWLAITAMVFALLWTFPGIGDYRVDWLTPTRTPA